MAINWKNWTARLPVKICCIILIVAMAFLFLLGGMRLAWANVGSVDEGMLFTDFNDNNYFFDRNAPFAQSQVQTAFSYQSEEHIRDMGCLAWEPVEHYYDDNGNEEPWLSLMSTNRVDMRQEWGQVRASDLESPEARRLLDGAIQNQISEYHAAQNWLDTTGGLSYYITDGDRVLTNAPDRDEDFFRSQPVYIIENGRSWEQSRRETSPARSWGYFDYRDDRTVYIAFSQQAVDYQNGVWKGVQRQLVVNLSIMGGAALVALIALIILLCGAGRRRADDGKAVHFAPLDRPWLDFGLAALVLYEVAICYWMFFSIEMAWRYDNFRWGIALCALLAVGFMLPLLGWVLSFAKRCKAGKWWRHTLIYSLYSRFRGFLRSLWAGVPLTARAVLIALAAMIAMLMTAMFLPMCLLFTALAAFGLLRYARRLHLLEKGAKAVSVGAYDTPIEVKGGELGSIAGSINSISAGINAAVAERMKSERLKTELITNVSHDIRTPLTSLITYTDLLKTEGLDSEKAPEYLDILIQKSARLKTLTDDLFEASKAASGSIDVKLETLDLADLVRQVLGELDERVSESGLDFRLNLPARAPVLADGRLLWRVMENLLSNVFKYALKGSRVYIDVADENGGFRLEVKNISEQPLNVEPSELTERFKRGDDARTDEGSGLGLSIAQSFVLAQGGQFALAIDGDLFKATVTLPAGQ